MAGLSELLENNLEWATEMVAHDPAFFTELTDRQSPEYLWIGCSDSRVPANQIVGLAPGEVFVIATSRTSSFTPISTACRHCSTWSTSSA